MNAQKHDSKGVQRRNLKFQVQDLVIRIRIVLRACRKSVSLDIGYRSEQVNQHASITTAEGKESTTRAPRIAVSLKAHYM